ncbi:GNAT family N-acetyltransferase [Paenibacillus macerans]|uniref:GNAT family N-acetyltransferase n=1 Tax=Paenibacillus macerans TaxID=44252 RepID=UPI003D31D688
MLKFTIRKMRKPDDYAAAARLVNLVMSEPTTAERLQEEDAQIPPGQLDYNEEGKLTGWDHPKWVAEDENQQVIGYAYVWRAPWTEPGNLLFTLIVQPESRGNGVGKALYEEIRQWAKDVKASRFIIYMRENDAASLAFAKHRGYVQERHTFESVLDLASFQGALLPDAIDEARRSGIEFVTLADETGETNERKLHELYRITHEDIPGYSESFPWFEEWKKWSIGQTGVRPEWIHIAKDGDRYVGVVTLLQNEQTKAMYHEYTGVLREYRGRHLALALKMLAIQTAQRCGVPYLRTHNDSMNRPMLRINRDLLGFRAEPGNYKMVLELA